MVEGDPFSTQRDTETTVGAELIAAGFDDPQEVQQGGFGTVYRCVQRGLDRLVAVKVVTSKMSNDDRARFLREQRAMGRLTGHPNVVTVLQVGQLSSGRPFLVMPFYARGSLDQRIRSDGPLPGGEVVQLGVKLVGALEAAHRVGIVHRDVKPANILIADDGEPELSDFGIAHTADTFRTSEGMVTASPAFAAPEILAGDPGAPASDVYGLGASLFCAYTGHAPFERQGAVAASFRSAPSHPNRSKPGLPDELSGILEAAMARDPKTRPSLATLEDDFRRLGHDERLSGRAPRPDADLTRNGSVVDGGGDVEGKSRSAEGRGSGTLPVELTSFVGRRSEVAQVRNTLASARLVTLAGMGGVGKTRLALRVAASVRKSFPDGVWLVELGDVRDPALVAETVATKMGVRDSAAMLGVRSSRRSLTDVLVELFSDRETLLVIDSCEQVVDAVAEVTRILLLRCPRLRILATSREPLAVDGETVVRVAPLAVPTRDQVASFRAMTRVDAVRLFVDRAASAVPGFELTTANKDVIAEICSRLDGVPLAIELAAARLRALSLEQLLERLTARFALLTRGSRSAPSRQRTLRWSVDWSYDLCSPSEQRMWRRVSVFAGTFDLDAAEVVCGDGRTRSNVLDDLTSLVEKSVLVRDEVNRQVRFRMLKSLREYGRELADIDGEHELLRRRHEAWCLSSVSAMTAEWVSSRQLGWVAWLTSELPNLRDAMEFSLMKRDGSAFRMAADLSPFWIVQGKISEGRRWLDKSRSDETVQPLEIRARALMARCELALLQGDSTTAAAALQELQAVDDRVDNPTVHACTAGADGWVAFFNGEFDRAQSSMSAAVDAAESLGERVLEMEGLGLCGWAHQSRGRLNQALQCHERELAKSTASGEYVYRCDALWGTGFTVWCQGDDDRATQLIEEGLRLTRLVGESIMVAIMLHTLAWICAARDPRRAVVLTGAADGLSRSVGSPAVLFPNLIYYRAKCADQARNSLDRRVVESAYREGQSLSAASAISLALHGNDVDAAPPSSTSTTLTQREHQVAELVAGGLTNREIAEHLVLSKRTIDGHVAHILDKLGFTSRAQIAAWITEQDSGQNSSSPS